MATSAGSKTTSTTSTIASPSARGRANDRPLVEDIRLLGRILGDVIREQEGQSAYELIEQVR
jgi:phosphoenolpyruvate carboxylase